jgi:hypothetical protein
MRFIEEVLCEKEYAIEICYIVVRTFAHYIHDRACIGFHG